MLEFNSDLEGQMHNRRSHMEALYENGINPFANDFKISHSLKEFNSIYSNISELVEQDNINVNSARFSVAGRLIQIGDFGRIKFLFITGDDGQIVQGLLRKNDSIELFELSRHIQIGDIIGVVGPLFRTKQEKRALLIENLRILTKALRPLPTKTLQVGSDLKNIETLQRNRSLDLIMHPEKIDLFKKRAKIIKTIRNFYDEMDFTELSTNTLQEICGGANAKPFVTRYNAINADISLRISPELQLKRAIIGGFQKVYELNTNWRNEGLDHNHNPEFSAIETYQTYSTYIEGMDEVEKMFRCANLSVNGKDKIMYGNIEIDFSIPFERKTMLQSVLDVIPDLPENCRYGQKLIDLFEERVEKSLVQPTFITQYPIEVSPLARRNDNDPRFTDRYELYIVGIEFANGYSEQTNPILQRECFEQQMINKNAGDEEAMEIDESFIQALELGFPPTSGNGIGIDRLVMLLINQRSIQDVILFPAMKKI